MSISSDLLTELERVMLYPKLGFDQARIEHFISQLLRHVLFVEPDQRLNVITVDDTDNRVLKCALASGASRIVSGDRHLLALGSFADIQIVTTTEILSQLED